MFIFGKSTNATAFFSKNMVSKNLAGSLLKYHIKSVFSSLAVIWWIGIIIGTIFILVSTKRNWNLTNNHHDRFSMIGLNSIILSIVKEMVMVFLLSKRYNVFANCSADTFAKNVF